MHRHDADDDIVPPFAPGPPTMALPPALLALQDQIAADLRATQGAWRDRSWLFRFAPLVIGAVVAAAPWAFLHARSISLAGILAGGSGLVAFIAVATATQRPMRGSILGTLAVVLAVGAVALEGFSGGDPTVVRPLFSCALAQTVLFVPPAVLVAWHLRRAFLPARRGHVAAVAAAGLIGCALVWLSCLDAHVAHRFFEHSVGATLLVTGFAALAQAWLRRSRPKRA